ncbi:MAG TPA: hypothetical protein VFB61_08925 [Gemmatimonadales bacterium]|nr:hypothetical protein [Gemmatimonadales bacterium]
MSPRKPTVDDLDDIDDEDGALEEEIVRETDLDLTVLDEADAGLGGVPAETEEPEEG